MLDASCIVVKDGRGVTLAIVDRLPSGEVEQHARLAASRRPCHYTFDWQGTCHGCPADKENKRSLSHLKQSEDLRENVYKLNNTPLGMTAQLI